MQPGDCIVFNGRTMHGPGSGKLDGSCDLKVFTTKWVGDDVRILNFVIVGWIRTIVTDMIEKGLKPGDRHHRPTDLYPRVWTLV